MKSKPSLRSVTGLGLASCLLQFAPPALAQGSLTPPPGAPAPTMKTLDQIEPRIPIGPDTTPGDNDNSPSLFKITRPGSYYLTTNLNGVSGKHGIEVTAQRVTIDLNGFELVGGAGTLSGVYAPAASGLKLHNGHIRSWGSFGVFASGVDGIFDDLRIQSNGSDGLNVGAGACVTRCLAQGNGNSGFSAMGSRVHFADCHAWGNVVGFCGNGGGILTRCVATQNSSAGFFRFDIARECVADLNSGDGFSSIGLVDSCRSLRSGRDGINGGGQIRGCTVAGNARHGISLTGFAMVSGNTISNNGSGSGVSDGAGIFASGDDSQITGNQCSGNDRGITVTGSHNQIEGNQLVHNREFGLLVTGEYNLIIRNTARNVAAGAINWNIAPLNRAGAYVAPANNAAINGNTGGNGSGTTDPFANLSF